MNAPQAVIDPPRRRNRTLLGTLRVVQLRPGRRIPTGFNVVAGDLVGGGERVPVAVGYTLDGATLVVTVEGRQFSIESADLVAAVRHATPPPKGQ